MKYIILLSVLSLGCNLSVKNQSNSELKKDYKQENGTDTTMFNKNLAGHPLKYYMEHKQIPQVCKDLFIGKRKPTDDSDVLSLMDSLFTNNNETRPFYFLTLTWTMEEADGAYAEPLGMMAKSFVEKRTQRFIELFINESILTKEDLDEWAKSVAGEIQISAEGMEKEEVLNVKNVMIKNCSKCSDKEKRFIDEFIKLLESHSP